MGAKANRHQKRDQQQADSRVLGQILAAQNIVFALPNAIRIAEFYAQTLLSMPGVIACRVCLTNAVAQIGELVDSVCNGCPISRNLVQITSSPIDWDFKCALVDQPYIICIPLQSFQHHFGFFVIKLQDFDAFQVYQPFVANLSNYVAITLENRFQRDLLEQSRDELEHKVAERTHDLSVTNAELEREIAERKRAEEDRRAHLWLLEGIDQINRIMQRTTDLNQMMIDSMDTLLDIFQCDRAWIVYPCDPEAPTWQVPMERTRPEYPGVLPIGVELPLDLTGAEVYRILRNTPGPVQFGPEAAHPVPADIKQGFSVQSFIAMAFYPKVGEPWAFGLHQCAYPRVWTPQETRLFQEIGRRLEDALSSLLMLRSLRESEEKYRTLFEESFDGLFITSPAGKILDMNKKGIAMLGYDTKDEIFRLDLAKDVYAHPPDRQRILNMVNERGSAEYEIVVKKKNGEQRVTYCSLTAVRDSQGAVNNYRGIMRDITERKEAERKTVELAAIVQSSEDAIIGKTLDGIITSWNRGAENIYGYTESEMIGRPIAILVPPEHADEVPSILEKICAGMPTERYETERCRKDGQRIFVSITVSPIRDAEGRVVAASTIARDITERKRAEESLRRYNQRLSILHEVDRGILAAQSPQSIAQAVLEQLQELIPCDFVSIILYDEDITKEQVFLPKQPIQAHVLGELKSGQSLLTNATARHRLIDELEAAGAHDALTIPMIAQERSIGVLALASTHAGFFTSEHQQIGEELAAQIAIAIHQATLNDQIVRHNQELEQRVLERTSELETANRELETFTYSVSHDLRAPLRAIQGFSEIISERHRSSLNEEGRRYFDNVVVASEQMNELIDNLLSYARLGRQQVQWSESISLNAILTEVVDNLSSEIAKSNAELHIASDLPSVQGNETLLRRVFTNLMQNSLVYHRPDVPPRIEINATSDAESVTVSVADNGIGIAPEFREKVFNVFFRLHNQDKYPGTGIGLAVVRKSIALLRGRVWIESAATNGSVFYLKLLCGRSEEKPR